MEESSDFTFCQVGSSSDRDNVESPKTIPDISNIQINDGSPGITTITERDASSNNSTSKDVGRSVPIFSKSFEFQTLPKKGSRPLDQAADVNGSGKSSEAVRKPVQRAKVPFEKGYSPMDWLKLTRTHPDLAELKGRSNRRLISMDEVRKHKTDGLVWTVLKGRVYNITPYLKFHPGGVDMLMKAAGKDCTALFTGSDACLYSKTISAMRVSMLDYFSKQEIQLQSGLDDEALLSSSELARFQTGSDARPHSYAFESPAHDSLL